MENPRRDAFGIGRVRGEGGDNFLFLPLPFGSEQFLGLAGWRRVAHGKIACQKPSHVDRISRAESGHDHRAEIRFRIKMTGSAQHSHGSCARTRQDLSDVTRGAVEAHRWESSEMPHLAPAKTNWPAKLRVWDQAKMTEVRGRKQIR